MSALVQQDGVVVRLEAARMQLAEAKTIQQSKSIADVAAAAEIYARRQQLGQEAIDFAHSIKIEALRKVGEMLKETPRNAGAKGSGSNQHQVRYQEGTAPQTLSELGIDKKTSSIAQKLADLPEKQFNAVRDGHESIGKAIAQVTASKAAPKVNLPATVPADEHAKLRIEHDELRALHAELVDELKTYSAISQDEGVKEMNLLRQMLAQAHRARDDYMRESAAKERLIKKLEGELKKLGWKGWKK